MLTKCIQVLIILIATVSRAPNLLSAVQPIDELPDRSYVSLGDINLGAFFAITEYSRESLCVERMRFPLLLQYVEAVVYAVNEINQNPSLLPNITLGYVILDDCVKQSAATAQAVRFLPRFQNTVDCYSGHIHFDDEGNMMGKYVVNQILPDSPIKQVPVRIIDTASPKMLTKVNSISWKFVEPLQDVFPPNAILPTPPFPLEDKDTPVSVCSRLCGVGEYKIQKELPCCWECPCLPCPIFKWPEAKTNLTTCKDIIPDYPIFTDTVVIFETCTSCLGIFIAVGVFMAYVYYREARIIKAASRELSFLQLFAILLGYITMLVYVAPPTQVMCGIAYWLFCFSFDLLYAPLLVKAIRIYRIFSSAAKGTRGLKLVSPLSQVVISCIVVMGQVIISILVSGLEKPTAILTQPVRSEAFVELSCDFTLPGLASFLAYNLTLVLLCSIFAFKTRKLPDNFNESRFMSMCVATTLVIWLAFIPTFLTSSRQYLKTLLLTLALLLNHSVALVFLFLSKLYAVIYLENQVQDPAANARTNGILRIQSRTEHASNNSINVHASADCPQSQI
ncbi:unnamed protein product [Candidula unifasciata]|uniref:G-protein coupled receptors family 3 profile domain-containing protein n=1 Tax=Candidula unifasciata TaxID=100452 RepID=A0A8S3Z0S4_9EUPU|nr:unnamed protein product [Candidula unifasciata]